MGRCPPFGVQMGRSSLEIEPAREPVQIEQIRALFLEYQASLDVYVQPARRHLGLGRLLVDRLLAEARAIGYRRIHLDTLPSMTRAAAMYTALGFQDIPP